MTPPSPPTFRAIDHDTDTGIDERLRRLLAEQDIRQTLARYCLCLDAYDIHGVAACFTPDAATDYGPGRGGRIQGREAIAARIAQGQAVFRRTHHQIGQTLITWAAGDVASTSYVTAWHERWDGTRDVLCLRYVDRLRPAHGPWQVAERKVEVAYCDGFAGVPWQWVPRRLPVGVADPTVPG